MKRNGLIVIGLVLALLMLNFGCLSYSKEQQLTSIMATKFCADNNMASYLSSPPQCASYDCDGFIHYKDICFGSRCCNSVNSCDPSDNEPRFKGVEE